MTFEGQYLTYLEYKDLVEGEGGSAMAEMPFNLLEFECRKKIDNRTQNRLVDVEDIPQEVKICEFKMINVMSKANEKIETINDNTVKSENIDGYSVTYATQDEVKEILTIQEQEINNIMEDMLMNVVVNGVHIIYLGVE